MEKRTFEILIGLKVDLFRLMERPEAASNKFKAYLKFEMAESLSSTKIKMSYAKRMWLRLQVSLKTTP